VTVSNWKTGDDAYTVPDTETYDVQSDGKLAFRGPNFDDVDWASPAEPYPHRVEEVSATLYDVRMAGDRIAAAWNYPWEGPQGYGGAEFGAGGLESPPPDVSYFRGILDRNVFSPMDFDGRHLIWSTRRCHAAWLMTWDLETQSVAGLPPRMCIYPQIVRGSARVGRRHALRLRLRCYPFDGRGCTGWIQRVGTRGRPLHALAYDLGHRTATVRLPRNGSLCRVSRHRARAKLVLAKQTWGDGIDNVGPFARFPRTVSARGPTDDLPRC
jgi:hypothetical protein